VLAVSIFAAAILISVNARRALLVILFVGSLASVRPLYKPSVARPSVLRASLEVLYRVITFGSAFYLWLRFAKVANWAHIFGPLSDGVAPRLGTTGGASSAWGRLFIDLIFGLSMLMVVLDQYRDARCGWRP